jgi:precorrin-6Y C5,15-methyltransferase (decarboxylating)
MGGHAVSATDSEPRKVHILGIGDDGREGLTSLARSLLDAAELIIGPEDALETLGNVLGARREVAMDPQQVADCVAQHPDKRIVVLAGGDPLFYGTARFLCDRLGKDRFEVVPHVSSMQLAFARVKESWDEAYLTNLANQPLDRAFERIRTAERVGMFTTETASPADVANGLLERGIDYFSAYVCENLGSPDERVTHAELCDLRDQVFSPLNVMILVRKPNVPDRPREMSGRRLFGNPDEMFLQSRPKRGLLTSAELRCIALAELDLGPSSIVWDVGAGSGSVAIEAAQIARHGKVYAIEKDGEDFDLIAANAERFAVENLTPILGKAPDAWRDLPEPDAIFIGGTGRRVRQVVEQAFGQLRSNGRLVITVASVENLSDVQQLLRELAGETNVWMITIARGSQQLLTTRFEAANPSFLVSAVK